MSTASFPLLRFKAFASWVSNSMLNLQGNKLAGNLRTCTAQHTRCGTCSYHDPASALGILTYQHYLCAISSADASQLRDVQGLNLRLCIPLAVGLSASLTYKQAIKTCL